LRDLALVSFFFGVLPWVFRRPWLGVLLMAWLSYMNPHRLCYSYAFEFPFFKIAALVTIFAAIIGFRGGFPWTRETVLLIVFAAWITFTTFFAQNQFAWNSWDKVIKIQATILLTLLILKDRAQIYLLVWVVALSLAFYGVKGGIFTLVTGGSHHVLGPELTFIEDNNAIALALAMAIPFMRYLQLNSELRLIRIGVGVMIALTGLAVIATYSRGGFVALSIAGVHMILKSRRRVLFTVLAIVFASAFLSFMPEQWLDRMHTIERYEEDGSSLGRINAWRFAVNVAIAHPITGGGFEAFTKDMFLRYAPNPESHHDAHSIYFEMLAEQGFIGLALFLTLGLFSWWSAGWIKKATAGMPDMYWASDLASMSQVGLVSYAIGGAFLGMAYFDLPYHIVSIIVLTKVIVKRELLARENEQAAAGDAAVDGAGYPAFGSAAADAG